MNTHDQQTEIESYPLDDATQELMQDTMQEWNAIKAFRKCPKDHPMIWLGRVFWVCEKCHTAYVSGVEKPTEMSET